MFGNAKNTANYLAKSETLPMFALRTGRECTTTKDILVSCSNSFGRSLVALLPRVVVTCSQNKRGCALSLYPYLNEFLTYNANRCQESATGAKCARSRRTAYETGYIHSSYTRVQLEAFLAAGPLSHQIFRRAGNLHGPHRRIGPSWKPGTHARQCLCRDRP